MRRRHQPVIANLASLLGVLAALVLGGSADANQKRGINTAAHPVPAPTVEIHVEVLPGLMIQSSTSVSPGFRLEHLSFSFVPPTEAAPTDSAPSQ